MPLGPKWQIIHAHSGRPGASPLPSQSVTAKGPFRSYLLQIETFTNQPNHLSKSVTVRTVFLSYLLQIKTFIGRTGPLSHSVTARHSFPQLLQVENVHCVPINPSFDITRQPCRHRQIHAPAWGTTSEDDLRLLVSKFQSARPHGARQAKHNVELFRSEFQSTRPRGARLSPNWTNTNYSTKQSYIQAATKPTKITRPAVPQFCCQGTCANIVINQHHLPFARHRARQLAKPQGHKVSSHQNAPPFFANSSRGYIRAGYLLTHQ